MTLTVLIQWHQSHQPHWKNKTNTHTQKKKKKKNNEKKKKEKKRRKKNILNNQFRYTRGNLSYGKGIFFFCIKSVQFHWGPKLVPLRLWHITELFLSRKYSIPLMQDIAIPICGVSKQLSRLTSGKTASLDNPLAKTPSTRNQPWGDDIDSVVPLRSNPAPGSFLRVNSLTSAQFCQEYPKVQYWVHVFTSCKSTTCLKL